MKYEKMIEMPEMQEKNKSTNLKDAFNFANSCRDKEIDRFWTRGLYFWGFIVASFTAYFAVFKKALRCNNLDFDSILKISLTSKIALFILSFICFVFCLSWLLVHKGSKFWQTNWEVHISNLEKEYIGKLYEVYLDTKNKEKFSKCPLSVEGYDFSVSKISLLCSLLLAICSFALTLFHIALFFLSLNIDVLCSWNKNIYPAIAGLVLFAISVTFMIFYCLKVSGNKNNTKTKYGKNKDYFIVNGKSEELSDD